EYVTMDRDIRDISHFGAPSAFTCPTCRGALWELRDGELVRYRCHIGHAFSADSLLLEQTEAVEQALESGLRAVEEKAATLRRVADRYAEKFPNLEKQYHEQAKQLDDQAVVIRHLLASRAA
ncbi:MAG TPA: hypothetical protein VKS79_18690, partial [Gemmataceae bacterium]|nr:hypothetical protein [Gemmataceae bacterium]